MLDPNTWRQQHGLPLVAALHKAYFRNGTVINADEITVIANRLPTFHGQLKNGGLSFVFQAEGGRIRIDLPPFRVGSSGPQVDGETVLFINGEVKDREVSALAILFRDAISDHNRPRAIK